MHTFVNKIIFPPSQAITLDYIPTKSYPNNSSMAWPTQTTTALRGKMHYRIIPSHTSTMIVQ